MIFVPLLDVITSLYVGCVCKPVLFQICYEHFVTSKFAINTGQKAKGDQGRLGMKAIEGCGTGTYQGSGECQEKRSQHRKYTFF